MKVDFRPAANIQEERSKPAQGSNPECIRRIMRKVLSSTLIMIAGLFMLAARARAQTGSVTVHTEQEFVAGTKVFPAGTYKVYPAFSGTGQTLILRSQDSGKSDEAKAK